MKQMSPSPRRLAVVEVPVSCGSRGAGVRLAGQRREGAVHLSPLWAFRSPPALLLSQAGPGWVCPLSRCMSVPMRKLRPKGAGGLDVAYPEPKEWLLVASRSLNEDSPQERAGRETLSWPCGAGGAGTLAGVGHPPLGSSAGLK